MLVLVIYLNMREIINMISKLKFSYLLTIAGGYCMCTCSKPQYKYRYKQSPVDLGPQENNVCKDLCLEYYDEFKCSPDIDISVSQADSEKPDNQFGFMPFW